ncbi:MAG TPA: amidohydrolase family protein [Tepidisphaeraceae bacterium]|jgi:guanine deaminase
MLIRGPILNPRPDGSVDFIPDGALASAEDGTRIKYASPWASFGPSSEQFETAHGILCPAFLDNHIHIPQHPIRGRFTEGIDAHPPEGRLIAGLNRNVFPAEARCEEPHYTAKVVSDFLEDTWAHGVIGGAAYMTVHTAAARTALEVLPGTWFVGPVLMNMNCPEYLRTDERTWARDVELLAKDFGRRVIVTDRFAVAVDSRLRQEAVALARQLGLRMQTHLNEQIREKRFVEHELYPGAGTYTGVYERDGLLDCEPILAHCVRMSGDEFQSVGRHSGAQIAHCPTSNTLLGSGVMPLDRLFEHGIEYAICTDVGASPTTSLLCEMAQFLKVHSGISPRATPLEALYRTTLGAAKMLGLDRVLGSFDPGKAMTFIEIDCRTDGIEGMSVDRVIAERVLEMSPALSADVSRALEVLRAYGLEDGPEMTVLQRDFDETMRRLDRKVRRVVVEGREVWRDFR